MMRGGSYENLVGRIFVSEAGLVHRNIADARALKARALRELDRPDLEPWQRDVWRREVTVAQDTVEVFLMLAPQELPRV